MNMKQTIMGTAITALIIGVTAVPVFAASLLDNGSFETGSAPGVFSTLGPGSTAIDNWEVVSGNIDYIDSYWQASQGDRSIDMTGSVPGTIRQNVDTVTGAVYTVSFDLSGNPAGGPAEKSLDVSVEGASQNFTYNTATSGNSLTDMKWAPKSFVFTAQDSSTYLTFTSQTTGYFGPALDNVRVEQYLPVIKDDCKKDAWKNFGVFKNQGDCVAIVATGGANKPALE